MLLIGFVAGVTLAVRQARRMGLNPDVIYSFAFWIFVAGIVGARVFFVIQYHEQFWRENPVAMIGAVVNITEGGLVVYGAFLGVVLAGFVFLRVHKLPVLAFADLIVPSLALGLAIGRIGCFLNGCCYGGPCELPWAVSFPAGTEVAARYPRGPDAASLPVHPAQLYAAIDAGLLAALAVAFTPLARRAGEVFALVLTLHPISRLLLEAIRVDEPPALGTPLSISQLVSLVLLALAAALWWWIGRRAAAEAPGPAGRGRL